MLLGTVNESLPTVVAKQKWFCYIFAGNSDVEVTLTLRTSNENCTI